MKRLLLAATACLLPSLAYAWPSDGTPTPPAKPAPTTRPVVALTQTQSLNPTTTSKVVNIINPAPAVGPDPTQRPGSPNNQGNQGRHAGSGGGRQGSGGGGNVDASTIAVAAPSLYSANTCVVGFSLAGGNKDAQGGAGFQWEADDCKRIRRATLMAQLGRPDVAIEIACKEPTMDVRYAMASRGTPCDDDRKAWIQSGWNPDPKLDLRRRTQ